MKASRALPQGPIAYEEIPLSLVDLTSPFMLPIKFPAFTDYWSVEVEVFLEVLYIPAKAAKLLMALSTNFKLTEEIFSACNGCG